MYRLGHSSAFSNQSNIVNDCIFCQIVSGEMGAHVVWQDDFHMAFLTPYPNTLGFTVVITKAHLSSYIVNLEPSVYEGLWHAAKEVALILDKALDTNRCAFIAEGMGVDHAHIKVVPLHGVPKEWKAFLSSKKEYHETYQGFVCSADGPRMPELALRRLAETIRNANN